MRSLDQIKEGEKVTIIEIRAGRGLHSRLANMGIHIGTTIQVVSTYSTGGPMLVTKDSMKLALGHGMTVKIFVKSANEM